MSLLLVTDPGIRFPLDDYSHRPAPGWNHPDLTQRRSPNSAIYLRTTAARSTGRRARSRN